MKLIIDIGEEEYRSIKDGQRVKSICNWLPRLIEQGIPLGQKCENCKILELLFGFELEYICEDDDKDFEYCENYCNFKAPTKECYLHWAEHKRKETE